MFDILKNKEFKNAGWIIGERMVQMLLTMIIGIFSARYLGPSNYGSLNYTAALVAFFSTVALLGMDSVIIKKMIVFPEGEGVFLGSCIVLRTISSFFCSLLIALIVAFLNPNDGVKLSLALLQSIQLVFQAFNIFDAWFQRYSKSKYVSIGKILAALVVAGYKIWLLATRKSIEWFAFSNSLMSIVIAIMLFLFYKGNDGPKLKINFNAGLFVLKDSYHYILSGLMVAAYGQMDRIMLGKMMGDYAVGMYTTATAICSMWVFIPTAIINSFRPTLIGLHQAGEEKLYKRRLSQLYSLVIWLCLGASIVVSVVAPIIIQVLYGKAYLGALNALRIVIWCEMFSMIGTARGIWILCEDKNKYIKYYLAIGVLVNLVLNAILIPVLGIEGAAVATLVTQIITSLVAPCFFKETRKHTRIVLDAFTLKWYFNP